MCTEITSEQDIKVKKSLITLANANELVIELVLGTVGNDVADSLRGSRLTESMVCTMAQNRFIQALNRG